MVMSFVKPIHYLMGFNFSYRVSLDKREKTHLSVINTYSKLKIELDLSLNRPICRD